MKFLECSRCLGPEGRGARQEEVADPLVMTKRPRVQPGRRASPPKPRRLPEVIRGALASWRSRRRSHAPAAGGASDAKKKQQQHQQQQPPPPRRMPRTSSRTQRLIRLYEDRASPPPPSCATPGRHEQLSLILEPPPSFDDSLESHQNFRNKLNTLDFRRMNTVALEGEPSTSASSRSRRSLLLEDFLKERMRIEQAMVELLNGTDRGSLLLRTPERKVRFEEAPPKVSVVELQEQPAPEPGGKVAPLVKELREKETTEIKLTMDPNTKVEDFYVERKTTYLKGKTVEDKALVLKLAPKDRIDRELEAKDGMARTQEYVFRNFGKLSF